LHPINQRESCSFNQVITLTLVAAIAENDVLSIGSGQVSSPEPRAFLKQLFGRVFPEAGFVVNRIFPNCADPTEIIALTDVPVPLEERQEVTPR
jgi:hypothetical protein